MTQELTFEAALKELQQTVKSLEGGELTLDQSLKSFEEGVKLTRYCQQHLTAAEQRVEILMKTPEGASGDLDLQPFGTTTKK